MDANLKFELDLMTIDERIAWSRNFLYRWKTGWTLLWLFCLEALVALCLFDVWDVPSWLMCLFSVLVAAGFLAQRSWAPPNGLGFLNLFTVWPLQFLLLVVMAPVFGPVWFFLLVFDAKAKFGKFAAAVDYIAEMRRRGVAC